MKTSKELLTHSIETLTADISKLDNSLDKLNAYLNRANSADKIVDAKILESAIQDIAKSKPHAVPMSIGDNIINPEEITRVDKLYNPFNPNTSFTRGNARYRLGIDYDAITKFEDCVITSLDYAVQVPNYYPDRYEYTAGFVLIPCRESICAVPIGSYSTFEPIVLNNDYITATIPIIPIKDEYSVFVGSDGNIYKIDIYNLETKIDTDVNNIEKEVIENISQLKAKNIVRVEGNMYYLKDNTLYIANKYRNYGTHLEKTLDESIINASLTLTSDNRAMLFAETNTEVVAYTVDALLNMTEVFRNIKMDSLIGCTSNNTRFISASTAYDTFNIDTPYQTKLIFDNYRFARGFSAILNSDNREIFTVITNKGFFTSGNARHYYTENNVMLAQRALKDIKALENGGISLVLDIPSEENLRGFSFECANNTLISILPNDLGISKFSNKDIMVITNSDVMIGLFKDYGTSAYWSESILENGYRQIDIAIKGFDTTNISEVSNSIVIFSTNAEDLTPAVPNPVTDVNDSPALLALKEEIEYLTSIAAIKVSIDSSEASDADKITYGNFILTAMVYHDGKLYNANYENDPIGNKPAITALPSNINPAITTSVDSGLNREYLEPNIVNNIEFNLKRSISDITPLNEYLSSNYKITWSGDFGNYFGYGLTSLDTGNSILLYIDTNLMDKWKVLEFPEIDTTKLLSRELAAIVYDKPHNCYKALFNDGMSPLQYTEMLKYMIVNDMIAAPYEDTLTELEKESGQNLFPMVMIVAILSNICIDIDEYLVSTEYGRYLNEIYDRETIDSMIANYTEEALIAQGINLSVDEAYVVFTFSHEFPKIAISYNFETGDYRGLYNAIIQSKTKLYTTKILNINTEPKLSIREPKHHNKAVYPNTTMYITDACNLPHSDSTDDPDKYICVAYTDKYVQEYNDIEFLNREDLSDAWEVPFVSIVKLVNDTNPLYEICCGEDIARMAMLWGGYSSILYDTKGETSSKDLFGYNIYDYQGTPMKLVPYVEENTATSYIVKLFGIFRLYSSKLTNMMSIMNYNIPSTIDSGECSDYITFCGGFTDTINSETGNTVSASTLIVNPYDTTGNYNEFTIVPQWYSNNEGIIENASLFNKSCSVNYNLNGMSNIPITLIKLDDLGNPIQTSISFLVAYGKISDDNGTILPYMVYYTTDSKAKSSYCQQLIDFSNNKYLGYSIEAIGVLENHTDTGTYEFSAMMVRADNTVKVVDIIIEQAELHIVDNFEYQIDSESGNINYLEIQNKTVEVNSFKEINDSKELIYKLCEGKNIDTCTINTCAKNNDILERVIRYDATSKGIIDKSTSLIKTE